jgi:hypothetical protein
MYAPNRPPRMTMGDREERGKHDEQGQKQDHYMFMQPHKFGIVPPPLNKVNSFSERIRVRDGFAELAFDCLL